MRKRVKYRLPEGDEMPDRLTDEQIAELRKMMGPAACAMGIVPLSLGCVTALLDEVEEARDRVKGVFRTASEPAIIERFRLEAERAQAKIRAASAMLAALMDAARRGNIVAEERLKAVIAIAHAAGIRPG